jgi:hypothetical protein
MHEWFYTLMRQEAPEGNGGFLAQPLRGCRIFFAIHEDEDGERGNST